MITEIWIKIVIFLMTLFLVIVEVFRWEIEIWEIVIKIIILILVLIIIIIEWRSTPPGGYKPGQEDLPPVPEDHA